MILPIFKPAGPDSIQVIRFPSADKCSMDMDMDMVVVNGEMSRKIGERKKREGRRRSRRVFKAITNAIRVC